MLELNTNVHVYYLLSLSFIEKMFSCNISLSFCRPFFVIVMIKSISNSSSVYTLLQYYRLIACTVLQPSIALLPLDWSTERGSSFARADPQDRLLALSMRMPLELGSPDGEVPKNLTSKALNRV